MTPLQTPAEQIRQRRAQMLVHSFLYYVLDDPIVSDHQWQEWADELVVLQAIWGDEIGFYDASFRDWDGSTGCHLDRDPWVEGKARQLLRYEEKTR